MRSFSRNPILGLIVTVVVFGGIFLYHEFGSRVVEAFYMVIVPVLIFSVIYWAVALKKK